MASVISRPVFIATCIASVEYPHAARIVHATIGIIFSTSIALSGIQVCSADVVFATANLGLFPDGYPLLRLDSMHPSEIVQRLGYAGPNHVLRDITFSAATNTLYGVGEIRPSFDYSLKTIDTLTGAATVVGSLNLPSAYPPRGIASDPLGNLYTWTDDSVIYKVDPLTGARTMYSSLPTPGIVDIEFYAPNRYYGLTTGGLLAYIFDVNVDTAEFQFATISNLVPSLGARVELDSDGTLYVGTGPGFFGYFNSFYRLDPATGVASLHDAAIDGINGFTAFTLAPAPSTPGDFNSDGSVDSADYVEWRSELHASYTPNDYNIWRSNFGRTTSVGSIVAPEPTDQAIFLCGAVSALVFCRLQRRTLK